MLKVVVTIVLNFKLPALKRLAVTLTWFVRGGRCLSSQRFILGMSGHLNCVYCLAVAQLHLNYLKCSKQYSLGDFASGGTLVRLWFRSISFAL